MRITNRSAPSVITIHCWTWWCLSWTLSSRLSLSSILQPALPEPQNPFYPTIQYLLERSDIHFHNKYSCEFCERGLFSIHVRQNRAAHLNQLSFVSNVWSRTERCYLYWPKPYEVRLAHWAPRARGPTDLRTVEPHLQWSWNAVSHLHLFI